MDGALTFIHICVDSSQTVHVCVFASLIFHSWLKFPNLIQRCSCILRLHNINNSTVSSGIRFTRGQVCQLKQV